jgi:uncharacterized protein (DUF488 family)
MARRRQDSVLSTVYTVGHSTRSQQELLELLGRQAVTALADVRAFPGSRRHPQFGREELARWLPEAGIEYVHMRALGGRRRPSEDSPNQGWRDPSFRGYADYMATPEFAGALRELEQLARAKPTAVMCAEAVWWRCHRRLIADALTARGWTVCHLGSGSAQRHELTPFAVMGEAGAITYPPEQMSLTTTTKEE